MRNAALLLSVLFVAACGGGVSGASPSPSRASATASASSTVTPGPSPTALSSAKGFITVRQPLANARVGSPVTISGDASVFEAALQWRITDSAGRVLAQGNTTASAGAPARGTFSVTATFTPPLVDTIGIVEVFDRSPRDGSIDEIVRVPVVVSR